MPPNSECCPSFTLSSFCIFAEGTPQDIRELVERVRDGRLSANAETFAQRFRFSLIQTLINKPFQGQERLSRDDWDQSVMDPRAYFHKFAKLHQGAKFAIFRCTGEFCDRSGRLINGVYYKSNLTKRQLQYIQTATGLTDWDDFYLGRNGWDVQDGGEYHCRYRRLKKLTNHGRCSEAYWDVSFPDSNTPLTPEEQEELNSSSSNNDDTTNMDDEIEHVKKELIGNKRTE